MAIVWVIILLDKCNVQDIFMEGINNNDNNLLHEILIRLQPNEFIDTR